MTFVDVAEGWQYGFPKIWDRTNPFEKAPLEEKKEWLISKGYPADMVNSTYFRYWEQQ